MMSKVSKIYKLLCRSGVLLLATFLLMSCGLAISRPPAGGNMVNPVVAEVKFKSRLCGSPFTARLDGADVTGQFSPLPPASQSQATFPGLSGGLHTLTAEADMDVGFLSSSCRPQSKTVTFQVDADTPYMAECRRNSVPIPPDWAESGTAWVLQGNLNTSGGGTNLLQGATDAFVWTYTDSSVRGACIALPRGSGAAGSLAGIICQSFTTGHACFWDNQLKSDPIRILGWSGQRLVISRLVDGTDFANGGNVGGRCVGCHTGTNVFIISPDDPTWAKVLRGPLNGGPSGSQFTTNISTARYIPLPVHPNWTNPVFAGSCGGCHEQPSPGNIARRDAINLMFAGRMPMPPSCTGSSCYGTP